MNVLFYLTRFPGFGGIETVTELIGNQLADEGVNITILTHLAQQRDSALLNKVEYHIMPDESSYYSKANLEFAESVVSSKEYDAIVYQDSYAPSEKIVCYLSKKYGIPLYVFEHNTPLRTFYSQRHDSRLTLKEIVRRVYWHPHLIKFERKRRKMLLKHCAKYVLLSKYFVNDLTYLMGGGIKQQHKLTHINNPIDYKPLDAAKLGQKENIVLTVCRLEDVKRVNLMLDMWKEMSPDNWKFVIVGDGSQRTRLEDKVRMENIMNVEFTGFTNPEPYYERARIFWMTSSFEGWGLTLVESMQKGCVPIVYDTFSALKDIVPSDEVGFVVGNLDKDTFIRRSQLLMSDTCIYESMAKNGIKYIEKYQVTNIVIDWLALLN